MFKRLGALEKSSGGLNVSFLNTHPASEERVKVCSLRLDHPAEPVLTHILNSN
jgi:predicted Zn-dependent protease